MTSRVIQSERARVDADLAAVSEGLRWDLNHASDEATRLIIASGLTIIEGCRIAVAKAKDSKNVEKHLRTLQDALSKMGETVARYRAKLDLTAEAALPGKVGSDTIH
jgi:hypothetical protein